MIAIISIQLVLSIVVILLNGMFIITFIKTRSLRTPSNAVLGCLCCSDLLIGAVTMSMSVYSASLLISAPIITFLDDGINMGKLFFASMGLSCLFMTLVNLDRYAAICHPYKYLHYATSRFYAIISVAVLLAYVCVISVSFTMDTAFNSYSMAVIVLIIFCVAALGFVLCAWKIFIVAHRHQREIASSTRNKNCFQSHAKRYRITVLLITVFSFCKVPPIIPFLLITTGAVEVNSVLISFGMTSSMLLLVNCIINPLVYYFRVTVFRSAVKEVLKCQRGT